MKKKLLSILALILALSLTMSVGGAAAADDPPSPTLQLAILLDGSGSITDLEWDTQIDGLIAALGNESCIPRDGSVELTVIQFGGNSDRLEWGPALITNDSWDDARDAVLEIEKMGGNSPLDLGINAAVGNITGENAIDGAWRIINIATDGGLNEPGCLLKAPAEAARDAAIAAGIDEIDAEGIGDIPYDVVGMSDVVWLRDRIVHPQPGTIYVDEPPSTHGWVYMVGVEAEKFKEAICQKVGGTPEPTYQVDVSSNPTGGGTVNPGSGQYVGNTMFTPIKNPGYNFVNWTIKGVTGETANPLTLDIQAATTLVANFTPSPPPPYFAALHVESSDGGDVTDPGEGAFVYSMGYGMGAVVHLLAVADEGYEFVNWTGDVADPNAADTTITMYFNENVTANFSPPVPPVLVSIEVTPETASIMVGGTQQYTATATYSDGSTADVTTEADWASSDEGIATVDAGGLATGLAVGSTGITATLGGITSGPATLNVAAAPPVLVSIEVTPESASITVGETQQYTAEATYYDGSVVDITYQVSWASDESVATIYAGLATGLAEGSTDITATLDGITSGPATLAVTAQAAVAWWSVGLIIGLLLLLALLVLLLRWRRKRGEELV